MTGAHGLTGGATVDAIARRGHDVIAIVRREADVPQAASVRVADASDPAGLMRALDGVDVLVHVAGIHLGERVAMAGIERLRRVVAVSTAGIYSAHRASVALYARNEAALRAARGDIALVRPTMIFGSERDRNVHRVVRFARRWRFLPVPGNGRALIQPIHYADLALALAILIDTDTGGVIDAGGGTPIALRDAARAILRALGMPERIVTVPLRPVRLAASAIDLVVRSRWRERVERTIEDRTVDNTRLVASTGVVPRDLPTGLGGMVQRP